jgi:hypothetical protein
MKIWKACVAAYALSLAAALPAAAATVTVDGHDWDITVTTTSFSASSVDLQAQPWWNSESKANAFASALLPSNLDSVFFPYASFTSFNIPLASSCITLNGAVSCGVVFSLAGFAPYAFATKVNPIPLPAGAPLVLSGIAALAGLQWRKRRERRRAQV